MFLHRLSEMGKKHFFSQLVVGILIIWLSGLSPSFAQKGSLVGQVVDTLDQAPLGYASIILYNRDSVQVNGTLVESSGSFLLPNIPSGTYYAEVRFLGYESVFKPYFSVSKGSQVNLGVIFLKPASRLLQEIEITGRKSLSYHTVDRQVYDAGQFQQAQGGNATDVVRNLPGVSINGQGEISLRGSQGFMVMLDGKQIQTDPVVLLNQLPANAIKNIEILTTPSAKFDPDGAGGIINITTASGRADGLYIQVNGLLGAPMVERYENEEASRRYGGDLTLNLIRGAWDLSFGLDYNRDDIGGRRVGYVNTYQNEILTEYPSVGERSFDRERYSGRLSLQYQAHKNHRVSLSFLAGDRTQYRTADILYAPQQRRRITPENFLGTETYWDLYNAGGSVSQEGELLNSLTYYNENLRVRQGDFLIGGLDYQWKLNDKSQLSLSALYEHTLLGGPTDNASLAWPNIADTLQFQFNTNDNPLDGFRFKADYEQKVGDLLWESGYQYRYLFHPGDFVYLDRDLESDRWIENPLFTNRIELTRQIHSLYSQVSGHWQKLQYSLGLRVEYMDREVSLAEPDTIYTYNILQPFPSMNLQYELRKNWFLKAGYSRRIERTTTFKMTPFPEREHNETLEQGDAELLPEFIDLAELGVIKNWGENSVFLTGYLRSTNNVINRVNTIFNDSILNRIYTNVGTARALGVELGTTLNPTTWLQFYLGGNVYDYRIKGSLFGDRINTSNLIYSINSTAQVRLAPTWNLQAGFNYLSERVTAQGVDSRFYNPSLTLKKTFADGKFSAALQWLSIDMGLLESNEQRITTVRDNFFTTTNYVYEVDRVLFTFSYQLNQPSKQMKFIESEFGGREY